MPLAECAADAPSHSLGGLTASVHCISAAASSYNRHRRRFVIIIMIMRSIINASIYIEALFRPPYRPLVNNNYCFSWLILQPCMSNACKTRARCSYTASLRLL